VNSLYRRSLPQLAGAFADTRMAAPSNPARPAQALASLESHRVIRTMSSVRQVRITTCHLVMNRVHAPKVGNAPPLPLLCVALPPGHASMPHDVALSAGGKEFVNDPALSRLILQRLTDDLAR
jgi:hypothetical protein